MRVHVREQRCCGCEDRRKGRNPNHNPNDNPSDTPLKLSDLRLKPNTANPNAANPIAELAAGSGPTTLTEIKEIEEIMMQWT